MYYYANKLKDRVEDLKIRRSQRIDQIEDLKIRDSTRICNSSRILKASQVKNLSLLSTHTYFD
jgi:hypothetical protein